MVLKKLLSCLCLGALLQPCLPAPLPAAEASGQEAAFCEDVKKPFFLRDCGPGGACTVRPGRPGAAFRPFAVPKPKGVRRIFVIGESAAQLLGAPELPGAEIINCGMGGYNSRRIEAVFEEALAYEPDLVVLLSGNNEGPEYPCPGAAGELRRRAAKLRERLHGLAASDVPAAVRASLRTHEERLDGMAAGAAGKKIPLALCTLPANLEMPPPGALPLESGPLARGLYLLERRDPRGAEEAFSAAAAAEPANLHALYWRGRALAAQGRGAEALENFLKVPELDPAQGRASRTRNAMIRRVAARRGAAVCDLEKLFLSSAAAAPPGFGQFADGVHWRRGYDAAVWRAIGAAAGAVMPASPAPAVRAAPAGEEELRRTFSYAVSGMDPASAYGLDRDSLAAGFIDEPALAELAFLEAQRPGLPEKLAASAEKFSSYFIRNSWSEGAAGRLDGLRRSFAAHLAELERRRGNYGKALGLIGPALRLEPEKNFYRLIRAQALHGLGRTGEAAAELGLLCAFPALREKAASVALARGLELPAWARSASAAAGAAAASKKLSDEGVALARAGDLKGAAGLLGRAVAAYPANAEARLSLCSLGLAGAPRRAALEECGLAAAAAAAYPEQARAAMTADAFYMEGRILAALNDPAAGAALAAALERAPGDWGRRKEASVMLEDLRRRAVGSR